MSKVDEDINNQISEVPPKKRKTQEDKEIEKIEVESTGGGFDSGRLIYSKIESQVFTNYSSY